MQLTQEQLHILKELMNNSAKKGNLANSGLVIENGQTIATAESWVVSSQNATDHSERMLVEAVCHLKHSNYTPGLTMISVVEPCLMCMSACSQAGYKELAYIIPAKRFVDRIPWVTDGISLDKPLIASQFSESINLIHLQEYEEEFSVEFEKAMSFLLNQ